MNETDRIIQALAESAGIASVTSGWPRQTASLPCAAVALKEKSAVDTRDNAVYLTKHVYTVRLFAQTMGACDALREPAAAAMAALGYALVRTREMDGETAQMLLTFEKID